MDDLTQKTNQIARALTETFLQETHCRRLSIPQKLVTLETFLAMVMAELTVASHPTNHVKFATGMSEELVTQAHDRVVKYLKEKGLV